jgi:subtilase family serine protease
MEVARVDVGPLAADECTAPIEVGPFGCPPCEFVTIGVEADNDDDVEECNEENNLLENEFHCPAPDLVITSKCETVNPLTCKFRVIFTVNNIGNCMAGASVACVYIDDEQVAELGVGPLAAGECTGPKIAGPFDFDDCPPGETVTIGVEADNDDDVEECNEDNNLLENEFHCPGPDLIILDKYETVNPETCTFTVTFVVANIGNCMARPSTACVYVDGDQVDVPIFVLAAGQWTPEITVGPFECTPGEIVTVIVEADNYDVVDECDEENNILENEFHCPGPDLVITDKEEIVDPETGTFTVTSGASVACVYIDGVHQKADVDVGALAADECTDPIEVGPFDCPLGEDIEVKVCADNYDAVEECDEENNCMTNILPCPGVPLPDLVITDIWINADRIHYTIENQGGADAPRSYTGLWINGDYSARDRVDPLAPGEESDEVFARENYKGGEIEVCADYQDRIEEIDEENNCMVDGIV